MKKLLMGVKVMEHDYHLAYVDLLHILKELSWELKQTRDIHNNTFDKYIESIDRAVAKGVNHGQA